MFRKCFETFSENIFGNALDAVTCKKAQNIRKEQKAEREKKEIKRKERWVGQ